MEKEDMLQNKNKEVVPSWASRDYQIAYTPALKNEGFSSELIKSLDKAYYIFKFTDISIIDTGHNVTDSYDLSKLEDMQSMIEKYKYTTLMIDSYQPWVNEYNINKLILMAKGQNYFEDFVESVLYLVDLKGDPCPFLKWTYLLDIFNFSEEFLLRHVKEIIESKYTGYADIFSQKNLSEKVLQKIVDIKPIMFRRILENKNLSEKFLLNNLDKLLYDVDFTNDIDKKYCKIDVIDVILVKEVSIDFIKENLADLILKLGMNLDECIELSRKNKKMIEYETKMLKYKNEILEFKRNNTRYEKKKY